MQKVDLQSILNSGLIHLYALGLASPEACARVEAWKKHFPELEHLLLRVRESLCARFSETLAEKRPEEVLPSK